MSADGNWKITLSTPMGPQEMTATITTDGGSFTGRIESPMGSEDISGAVAGDNLAWDLEVTKPMKIKVSFDVIVAGDTMSGKAKLGMFGSADVTGERI